MPFCTEACYTTLTSCEDPTKMLMRVCILLLMQPAPLTGTATQSVKIAASAQLAMQPAPLTGTATVPVGWRRDRWKMQPAPLTGTATDERGILSSWYPMQPAPLTGTATFLAIPVVLAPGIAGCSPHPSRGQQPPIKRSVKRALRCSPRPSRGRKKGRQETALFLVSLFI